MLWPDHRPLDECDQRVWRALATPWTSSRYMWLVAQIERGVPAADLLLKLSRATQAWERRDEVARGRAIAGLIVPVRRAPRRAHDVPE